MKNIKILALTIIAITIVPPLYIVGKGAVYFSQLEDYSYSEALEKFAGQVATGEMENLEIADRIGKMAEAERKIASGSGLVKLGLYFGLLAVFALGFLQAYLLRVYYKHITKLAT